MKKVFLIFFCANLLVLYPQAFSGQLGKLKSKIYENVLKRKPVLTTSLEDATTEVPFLDDYNPSKFYRIKSIPLQSGMVRYYAIPGCWTITLKSYCLHAGKHAPREGEGYLYAPLKGEWAYIIKAILQRSVAHPEISQHVVQSLIWGILARTKISDMPSSMKIAAAKLLTPQEILTVNGGALGSIPQAVKEDLFRSLPPAVREVIEVEATIREMLKSGIESYEALEKVAIRAGIASPQPGDRNIPTSRWSYHPKGYFVRYSFSDYSRVRLQISIPPITSLRFDDRDRLISVRDWRGNSVEIEYDDNIPPLIVEQESQPIGYSLRRLSFTKKTRNKTIMTKEWIGNEWTLVSLPDKKNRSPIKNQENYPGFVEALGWAFSHNSQVEHLLKQASPSPLRDLISERITKLGYITYSAQHLFQACSGDEELEKRTIQLLKEGWQQEICLAMMEHKIPRQDKRHQEYLVLNFKSGPFGGYENGVSRLFPGSVQEVGEEWGLDLSGDSAVPGTQGTQPGGTGGPVVIPVEIDLSDEEEYREDTDMPWENPEWLAGYKAGYNWGEGMGILHRTHGIDYDNTPKIPVEYGTDYSRDWEVGFKDGYTAGYNVGYWETDEKLSKPKKRKGR